MKPSIKPITKVDRLFETAERLEISVKEFEDSKMFVNWKIEPFHCYKRLVGVSNRALYDLKTKFSDAVEV